MKRFFDAVGAGFAVIAHMLRQAWPKRIPAYVYEAAHKVGITPEDVIAVSAEPGVITIVVAACVDLARMEGLVLQVHFAVPATTSVRVERAPWRTA